MKSILRKLHITHSPSDDSAPKSSGSPQKAASGISSWLNSVSNRHASSSPPPIPAAPLETPPIAAVTVAAEGEMDEEEYQIQVALELSAKEDPEAAQIEAVKQISLGTCSPENSPAEVLAYRYWSYNALDYDDKVLDGFYDLYGVMAESSLTIMPSLVDLQGIPVSDGINWEAVLVNREDDAALVELEQRARMLTLDLKSDSLRLVKSLGMLVARHMGGIVFDPVGMSDLWRKRCNYLRSSAGNMVLPLGCLTIGLARHRALLFKVLADSLGIPCRLLKGQQYTGSDDGALTIIKLIDGREYIVDLMVDPGALLPSDAAGLARDYKGVMTVNSDVSSSAVFDSRKESLKQIIIPSSLDSPESGGTSCEPRNQECERFCTFQESSVQDMKTSEVKILDIATNSETIKGQAPSSKSNYTIAGSPSWAEGIDSPASRMMKVKDISQYMINATKENPQLAQKLHDVLLESGVAAPRNLFSENFTQLPEEKNHENKDDTTKRNPELKHKSVVVDSLFSPHMHVHDLKRKVTPFASHLESMKPVEGLGALHPLGFREAGSSPIEATSHFQDNPLQVRKHMPVAAAAATAAVVASSMVVAAAKSKNDMNLENPVATAATATAAAVVATTAAVSMQYEYLESLSPASIASGRFENTNTNQKAKDVLNSPQLDGDNAHDGVLVPEQVASETHQEAERKSDRSTGNESTKSDLSLDDVAELEIPWEDIILGERIGLGSYGEVYRAEWHGTEIAVKKFLHQDISTDALEEFITEVRIMKRVRHPNVLLLMGAVTHVPNLSIVTEFLPRGSLYRLIHRPNNQLDERRRMRMALDVARGMNYLHNCTPVIVHRDLKSPNLLVDKNWVVKVCDFGLSRMKLNTFLSSRSTAGTAEWMAPEVLRNEPSDEKCDVYSFGVILWELCTMQQPWGGMNPMQVVGAVGFQHRCLDIPADTDPVVADIISKCWQTDPKMRPSFSEIMLALKPLQRPVSSSQVQKRRG